MKKVLVPLAEGFEDIEAVSIIDVLRRGGVEVVTAALDKNLSVMAAHGIRMEAERCLADVIEEEYDAIILPGGGKGTNNLMNCAPLHDRLRRQKEEGRLVCAICAAPTVLDAADVIDEESVTCYPSCAPQMSRHVANVPVVADGCIITANGPGSSILFSLVVLAHLEGESMAHRVANGLITEFR